MELGIGEQFLLCLVPMIVVFYVAKLAIAIAALLVVVISALTYLWYDKSYWKRQGIPSPKCNFIFGHSLAFFTGIMKHDMENMKNYGPTYGTYLFSKKEIVSADLDLLRRVLVKDFGHFEDRMGSVASNSKLAEDDMIRNVLSIMQGDDWKRVRNLITPAFTTGKIKRLVPIFEQSVEQLCVIVDRHIDADTQIPIKETFGRVNLDMIARAAFAIDINTFEEGKESPFIIHAKKMFQMPASALPLAFFPFLVAKMKEIFGIDLITSDSKRFFRNALEQLYAQRRNDPEASEKTYSNFC
jgi:cytochrome P450